MKGHKRNDSFCGDFCDSLTYNTHPLFSNDQNSLEIMVYYDDLEICNPIGSRATKHKLGRFGCSSLKYLTGLPKTDFSMYNNNALGNLYFSPGVFYYCLGNISPQYRSSLNAIQLFAIVKQSCLKYYGINKILEPFMEDIKALENVSSCFFLYFFNM